MVGGGMTPATTSLSAPIRMASALRAPTARIVVNASTETTTTASELAPTTRASL